MRTAVLSVLVLAAVVGTLRAQESRAAAASIHDLSMKRIDGTTEKLGDYAGKVLLVVNVASECGYTPQYEGLQKLHQKYADRGFSVLGFPSNDFGQQEPGSDADIFAFCTSKWNVKFPLFSKVAVVGPDAAPLYKRLQQDGTKATTVKWNFHKFLIDGEGTLITAFGTKLPPQDPRLAAAIEAALSKRAPESRGIRLLVVAVDGMKLPDGTTYSEAAENKRMMTDGDRYAPPTGLRWYAGPREPREPNGGLFLYYDPEFWGAGQTGFTEADVENVKASQDRLGQRTVEAGIKVARRDDFERYTTKWVNKRLAAVVDDEIVMAPYIQQALKDSFVISFPGGLSAREQRDLVERLRGTK